MFASAAESLQSTWFTGEDSTDILHDRERPVGRSLLRIVYKTEIHFLSE